MLHGGGIDERRYPWYFGETEKHDTHSPHWNRYYGCQRKGVEKMISVVMERGCRNPKKSGPALSVGGKLGGMSAVSYPQRGILVRAT